MERKRISVNFEQRMFEPECCYIHKYYLPNDLKALFCPADIEAVQKLATWESHPSRYLIPNPVPALTIHYKDINAEKRMTPKQLCTVLAAMNTYEKDVNSELTAVEKA